MFSDIYRLFYVFRSYPFDCCQSPRPCLLHPRLIRSLTFSTWVMAFVILNDSRNKSTVMRSHWVRFFFFFFSPFSEITLHSSANNQPVPETHTPGPGSKLQCTCMKQINSFLGKTSLQPKWTPCPPNIQDLLSFDSLELTSWIYVNAVLRFQTLPHDIFSIFIDLFRFSSVCIYGRLSRFVYDNAFI